MGLVENIEVFDELLRNGVPTKKFVNYKNWDEVLKLLAKSSTDRYAQLPSGQVVKILDKVALSPGSTATANYALANVSVAETEILYGDAVIDMVTGETIALGESTTGIVVSGTTDAAAAGSMGTVTACESGFLITPAFVVVAAVAALCGFAIGEAVGAKIVAELNDEEFDWGEDTYTGKFITGLVGDIKDGVLVRYKLGGKTFFDENLVNRIYDKLVEKDFFYEGESQFKPIDLENGKTYEFTEFADVLDIYDEQVNIALSMIDIDGWIATHKVDYPPYEYMPLTGWNEHLEYYLKNMNSYSIIIKEGTKSYYEYINQIYQTNGLGIICRIFGRRSASSSGWGDGRGSGFRRRRSRRTRLPCGTRRRSAPGPSPPDRSGKDIPRTGRRWGC